MAELTEEMTEEIQKLERHCAVMKKEEEREDTLLAKARRLEIENIRHILSGLLESHELLETSEVVKMLLDARKRVRDLRFNPESAGNHNHMLGKKP